MTFVETTQDFYLYSPNTTRSNAEITRTSWLHAASHWLAKTCLKSSFLGLIGQHLLCALFQYISAHVHTLKKQDTQNEDIQQITATCNVYKHENSKTSSIWEDLYINNCLSHTRYELWNAFEKKKKKHQRPNNTYRTDIAEEDNGLSPQNSVVLHIEHTLNRFISTAQKITGQIFLRCFCAVKTDLYQLARFSTPHIEQLCSNSYKLQTCIL